ncbi:MAG TPA: sugar-binding protein, partial [Thermoanaerobaculia bacterium]|nr:sugar-binding protein [Thermoanaerobaculia bacterium]
MTLIAVIIFATATVASALEVRKSVTPIRIDAMLDEPAWQDATPIAVGYEWEPGENIAASVATEALVTWDDEHLYVAFRARDPHPDRIRARFNERDLATNDDNVGFFIDPFNDDRRAYQFRINAL